MYLCSHTLPAAVLDPDKLLQGIWVMQLTETIFGPPRSLSVLSRHGSQMVMGCVFVCWCVASRWDRQTLKPCWFHVFYGFLIFLSHFTLCGFFSITRLANEV